MIEPLFVAELLLLGTATGFLAGLLGIGGGMVMVPFLTLILSHRGVAGDLAVKMAIATSMATILFTSLSSVRAHHRRGAVRWRCARAPRATSSCASRGSGPRRSELYRRSSRRRIQTSPPVEPCIRTHSSGHGSSHRARSAQE